jgi:hypothetical protein
MSESMKSKIETRLSDPNWDKKIAIMVLEKQVVQQKNQYMSWSLALSLLALAFSFSMYFYGELELMELQNDYWELMGYSPISGIEEFTSFME